MYIPYGSIDVSSYHHKPTEGDHLDEADSAIDALREHLDPAHFRVLEHLAGRSATRENPPRRKDYRFHVLTQEYLFRMAFLTTGQWGPPRKDLWFRGAPTVANPRAGGWAWDVPFFTRMAQLHEEIVMQIAYANTRYDIKKAKPKDRDWVLALDGCRLAVEWVLGQESAARNGMGTVLQRSERPVARRGKVVGSVHAYPVASQSAQPADFRRSMRPGIVTSTPTSDSTSNDHHSRVSSAGSAFTIFMVSRLTVMTRSRSDRG